MASSLPLRPRVFLDVHAGAEPIGRLVIELFTDKTPKTCENFRTLCNGAKPPLTYKVSPFHRVIDDFMVQGGDITKGDGTGGESIYGGEFEDENVGWRNIDKEGLVCMANRGKATNSSQFFITLAACDHLNGKHTIFGQLVSGQQTLERIAKVEVDDDDRPRTELVISSCGELERRKKVESHASISSTKRSQDATDDPEGRGRRKRRRSRSKSPNQSTQPKRDKTSQTRSPMSPFDSKPGRRSSDYKIDENLRGRERKRAEHRKDSPSDQEDRRRSRSPSRPLTNEQSRSPDYRRRRSLPNHYERRDAVPRRRADEESLREEELRREGDRDRFHGVDRHHASNRHSRCNDSGRLGGAGWEEQGNGNQIKFKGRGSMKYRERG